MKTLNDYVEKAQTKMFDKYNVFFAFGSIESSDKYVEGVEYVSMGHGMICPKEHAQTVLEEMTAGYDNAIEARIKDYGIDRIIQYELGNYESQISMDYDDAFRVLQDYGVTEEKMIEQFRIYMDYCREHDLF